MGEVTALRFSILGSGFILVQDAGSPVVMKSRRCWKAYDSKLPVFMSAISVSREFEKLEFSCTSYLGSPLLLMIQILHYLKDPKPMGIMVYSIFVGPP